MQQSVEATQINEGTEISDVLHDTFTDLTYEEFLDESLPFRLTLCFENYSTRNHDVTTTLVKLDDLELVDLTNEIFDVRHTT